MEYTITAKFTTDHELTEEERETLEWNVQLAVSEPCDDDGEVVHSIGASLQGVELTNV